MALGMEEHLGKEGRKWVRWSKDRKELFLHHLAGTCNVKASAEAAGVQPISVYALRRRDPEFAAAWGEALQAGYEMLETLVVGHAMSGAGQRSITDGGLDAIDIDLALRLLSHHRNALHGKEPRGGPKVRRATREETDKAILTKLDAYERRVKAEAAAAGHGVVIEATPVVLALSDQVEAVGDPEF